jgi:hypothetical protein
VAFSRILPPAPLHEMFAAARERERGGDAPERVGTVGG